ncbi:MAG: GMC family oxidoreductase N-terminal domain-containing protein [Deltaproteobacteria bacterium]|nr:GMC family oxidoreductase N-terminal domain-containing protein [Deltaproteobacteria bacterium]
MSTQSYDYIVIGAGSAGCVIANRLGEDPKARILVIEAGGSDKSFLFRRPGALAIVYESPQLKAMSDWGYKTAPQKAMDGRVMPWTRGKVLGGCSSVNGMLYIRGHRANYDEWRDWGNPGWGYDDVLPYFKKSESFEKGEGKYHGGRGPLGVTSQENQSVVTLGFNEAIASACGVRVIDDFNGEQQEGACSYHQTCANRKRISTSVAFLYPAMARGNVEVADQALVHKIVIENGRATGVVYSKGGATFTARAGAEVILSGGAIGSPQILMLSGVGPADHLKKVGVDVVADLPGVGQNLHDHLMVPVRYETTADAGHTSTAPHYIGGMLRDFLFNKGWFGKTFLEGGAFVKTRAEEPIPDLQFFGLPWAYPEPNDDGPKKGVISKKPSFTVLAGMIYPKSRGEIRLQSTDPNVAPSIDPRYLEDPDDMRVMVRGLEIARAVAGEAAFKRYVIAERTPGPACSSRQQLEAHVRMFGKTIYHPVGTCKMGNDPLAVVNHELRVHGVAGLRVADASIMPKIVGGNTNAPSIMIGEKCSDLIRSGRA